MSENTELFRAVEDKDLDKLLTLFNNTDELISARDSIGKTVLHYSIQNTSKEIFNYLLTLDNLNINAQDNDGTSPLHVSAVFTEGDPYYIKKLLEKGADPDVGSRVLRETPLHWAVSADEYLEIARLLIESGANINACRDTGVLGSYGNSVLIEAIVNGSSAMVQMLLYYGVDVFNPPENNRIFEQESVYDLQLDAQKMLLYYMVDDLEPVNLELVIAITQSPSNVLELLELIESIDYDIKSLRNFEEILLFLDESTLVFLLNKFDYVFEDLISSNDVLYNFLVQICNVLACFSGENLERLAIFNKLKIVLDSKFAHDLIQNYENKLSVFTFLHGLSEASLFEIGSIFLSYGLEITIKDLFEVYDYETLSKNDLFKLMLHMDVVDLTSPNYYCYNYKIESIVPALMFDPSLTIEKFLSMPEMTSSDSFVDYLLNYSALPAVKRRVSKKYPSDYPPRGSNFHLSPEVPLLVEFARNVSRQFLIDRFNIKKSSQYLTVVNKLEIPRVCKDILCFYKRLYDVII